MYDSISNIEVFTQTHINQKIHNCAANENVCHKIHNNQNAQTSKRGNDDSIINGYLKLLN
ncbi:hypothetical protein GW891_05220 [bacterium]|nr:hypothetical protein [bacterium]